MIMNIQKYFLFTVGLLLCLVGCQDQRDDPLQPDGMLTGNKQTPDTQASTQVNSLNANSEAEFQQHLLPILTSRCAFAGCHVAGGPEGIDLSTYQAFLDGGYDEAIFVPGNANESDIIEEIVSGRMPPGGPPLPADQIQLFRDWINQQDPADFINLRYDDDDDDDHDDHDHDDDDDDDDDHDDDDD